MGNGIAECDKMVSSTLMLAAIFAIDTNFPEVWTKSSVLLLDMVSNLGCSWSLLQSLQRICQKLFRQAQHQLPEHKNCST